jgi:hypothetical protein
LLLALLRPHLDGVYQDSQRRRAGPGGVQQVDYLNAATAGLEDDLRVDGVAVSVTGRLAFALDPVAVMVQGCDEFAAWRPSECPRAVIGRWRWGAGLVRLGSYPGGPPRLALAEGECG